MSDAAPALPLVAAFVLASTALAVTPGPGVVYVVTRTLAQGRRAGLVSVAGVALGNWGNALGASLGLAALFAASALAFTVVKAAGALYLFWLAWQTLRGAGPAAAAPPGARTPALFRDGLVVALLNPKTALFFAAFLPPFIDPAGSTLLQAAAYASAFVAIAAASDAAYVCAAARVAPRLQGIGSLRRAGAWLGAAVYAGLGVYALASGSRPSR
ncbi:LysE family translocator [Piscinibacter koreensis]|uniref:LysE family translocator n=1 Tax=Piscinibacter koreensis TaxID=2742824 RepID=A0A7Y6TVW8_9BURK|nr:LysE family translocator [Schlegelella koreensis]NUZ05465.1 LysE family translocator [Schlegelella koreensis]